MKPLPVTHHDVMLGVNVETSSRKHLATAVQALYGICEMLNREKNAARSQEQGSYLAVVKLQRENAELRAARILPKPGPEPKVRKPGPAARVVLAKIKRAAARKAKK